MCLAVPARIVSLSENSASVSMEGNTLIIDISMTPDVRIGDWVIVHAGFSIEIYSEDQALETLSYLRTLTQTQGE